MFEITDEFLAQAGFTTLSDEQRVTLKEQVTQSVQNKIGERIVNQVGEERSAELTGLMDGDAEQSRKVLEMIDANYVGSEGYQALSEVGKASGASDDEIMQEYAVIAWMKHNGINIAGTIQESMNEAMAELTMIYQQAVAAVQEHNE